MTISPVSKKRKPDKKKKPNPLTNGQVKYICLSCLEAELIPLKVVRDFDRMDGGDPSVPPQFRCESCGGTMYPEHYKGVHGYEYHISDILQTQKDRQGDLP